MSSPKTSNSKLSRTQSRGAKVTALIIGGSALLIVPVVATQAFAATDAAPTAGAIAPASVITFDQKMDGKAVSIKYAQLPRSGYVVIYGSEADGSPAKEPLGYVALKAGDHRDVKVELSATPAPKSRLWTSLYEDKDGDAKLKKGADPSFWADRPLSAGGSFVTQ